MKTWKIAFNDVTEENLLLRTQACQHIKDVLQISRATIGHTKLRMSKTASEYLEEAETCFEESRSTVEELKDEIESWKDGMPENLQQTDKYSELETCCDQLDEIVNAIDEIEADFPAEEHLPKGAFPPTPDERPYLSRLVMTFQKKGLQRRTVIREVECLDPKPRLSVDEGSNSRADRLSDAQSQYEQGMDLLEEVKDKIKGLWFCAKEEAGLSEEEREEKATEYLELGDTVQELIDKRDDGMFGNVDFPGMY